MDGKIRACRGEQWGRGSPGQDLQRIHDGFVQLGRYDGLQNVRSRYGIRSSD